MKRYLLIFWLLRSMAWATWSTPKIARPASCSSAMICSIKVSSTGSGHLLLLYTTTVNQRVTITGITGGATGSFNSATRTSWYRPSGGGRPWKTCSASDSTAGSIDCAFVYSSTAGSTTVTVTYSGLTGGARVFFYEVSYTNGPIAMDVNPIAQDLTPSGSTTPGVSLNLTGSNDFIVQGINGQNLVSSVKGGYMATSSGRSAATYLANTTTGTAPTWMQSSSPAHAAVSGISFAEAAGVVTALDLAWQAANRTGIDGDSCYEQGNVVVSGGYLQLLTTLQNTNCESIDYEYATQTYRSSSVSMRNLSFTYGTVEFRAKLGGGNRTGAWPVFEMFNACSLISYPYGTDNNCVNTEEIDITEINRSNFLNINQQIHLSSGSHDDGCSPKVSDASQNFHVYDLIWSPGSLIWKVDGVTTCTITKSYVPSDAMYFFIDMNAGSNGGTVNNSSLPWTTLVDYVKITQGSTVIFDDEFNGRLGGSTDRRSLPASVTARRSAQ